MKKRKAHTGYTAAPTNLAKFQTRFLRREWTLEQIGAYFRCFTAIYRDRTEFYAEVPDDICVWIDGENEDEVWMNYMEYLGADLLKDEDAYLELRDMGLLTLEDCNFVTLRTEGIIY